MFMHTMYNYTIIGFFDPAILVKTVWSLEVALVLEALIIVTVQVTVNVISYTDFLTPRYSVTSVFGFYA